MLLKRQGRGREEGRKRERERQTDLGLALTTRPLTRTVPVNWFGEKPGHAESRDEQEVTKS